MGTSDKPCRCDSGTSDWRAVNYSVMLNLLQAWTASRQHLMMQRFVQAAPPWKRSAATIVAYIDKALSIARLGNLVSSDCNHPSASVFV